MAPIAVEMIVAGITSLTELMKYGLMPWQLPPTQPVLQTLPQALRSKLRGNAISEPL